MRGPGPELMAFSKKKREREKNGLASLKTKGRGKLVELLGDHMPVLHPSHPHHTLYTLACFRFADRVPSFFFSFSTVKKKTSTAAYFVSFGVSDGPPYCVCWRMLRALRFLRPTLVRLRPLGALDMQCTLTLLRNGMLDLTDGQASLFFLLFAVILVIMQAVHF
jgi:hypothetical protein